MIDQRGRRGLRIGLGLLAVLAALPSDALAAPVAFLGPSVFESDSLSVTATVPLRIQAVHPSGALAYGFVEPPAGGPEPDTAVLGALDTRTNTVVATLPVPFRPSGLALAPDGTRLYVTGRVSPGAAPATPAPGTLLVVEPSALGVLASLELPAAVNTSAPLLHPTGLLLYVVRDTTIDVVAAARDLLVTSIQVPTADGGLAAPFIHPSGRFLYATTGPALGLRSAVVIDTQINALVRTLPIGHLATVGAILPRGPDNALLFTTGIILGPSRGGGGVFDAATGQSVATLALPGAPITAIADPEDRAVYLSLIACGIPSCGLRFSPGVAVVDGTTLEVTAVLPAGIGDGAGGVPSQVPVPFLAVDPAHGRLYALGASLSVVDLDSRALVADVAFFEDSAARSRFVFGPERPSAPGSSVFFTQGSAGVATAELWGVPGDQPVPADYDGDGRADVAVWRPRHGAVEGVWFVHRSSDGAGTGQQWGAAAFGDRPVPADYDGDGRADLAVWRPIEGTRFTPVQRGIWYIVRSSDGVGVSQQWGTAGDVPVPADYDGDGRADLAVWRAGTWYIVGSRDGSVRTEVLGEATDVPVPADYDGDGRADLAVWRPNTGEWWIVGSRDGALTRRGWGAPGDRPVPADYDGDGRADLAVWRSATGDWWVVASRDGAVIRRQWGAPGDRPLPADHDGDGVSDFSIYRP